MERMEQLATVTESLKELVNQPILAKNREEKTTALNELLEKRADILQTITPPYTEKEQEIGKKLLLTDAEIQGKLGTIFLDLKMEMRTVKKQKTLNKQYTDPYSNVASNDGSYWDKKK